MLLRFWALLPIGFSTYFELKRSLSSSVRANRTKLQKSWHGNPPQSKQVVIWGVFVWWGDQGSRRTLVTNGGGGESRNGVYFITIKHSKIVVGYRFSSMLWVLHSRGCRLWALNQGAKGSCGGGNRGKVLENDRKIKLVPLHMYIRLGVSDWGWGAWLESKVAKYIGLIASKHPTHWQGPELPWTSKFGTVSSSPVTVVQRHLAGRLCLGCFRCVNRQRTTDPEQALFLTANIKYFYVSQCMQFYCFLVRMWF